MGKGKKNLVVVVVVLVVVFVVSVFSVSFYCARSPEILLFELFSNGIATTSCCRRGGRRSVRPSVRPSVNPSARPIGRSVSL